MKLRLTLTFSPDVRVVMGSGKFEEIMVASQEVAASTAQLVIASRVKAREGSHKFHELRLASKLVTEATGAVVAVAKSSSVTAESKRLITDLTRNISTFSFRCRFGFLETVGTSV